MYYILLNTVVLSVLLLVLHRHGHTIPIKKTLVIFSILFILTLVFDSLIIAGDIVAYDSAKILGVSLIKAPVEDFAYTVAAVILIPYLWRAYASKN